MKKILFICTHNRCRSILAEAVTNHFSGGLLEARSAGSEPAGQVHPLSLRYLQGEGIPTDGLRSESWDAYEAWQPDIVITVCDNAAGETCPVWFGDSLRVHWGLADPSAIDGNEAELRTAFLNTINVLRKRIATLCAQPELLNGADRDALKQALDTLSHEQL